MIDMMPHRALAARLFDETRALSSDGEGEGVSRASYGAGESRIADYLRTFAQGEGLQVQADRAGNLVFGLPGVPADAPVVLVGSHMDSVPHGGHYDGLAGVVAAVLCLVARQRAGRVQPLQAIGFRGEESAWFGRAYIGSSSLLGQLDAQDLALRRRGEGETLAEAMRALGVDVAAIERGEVLRDPRRIKAYVELHIEQGPVMIANRWPVAVVSGIRGNFRHNQVFCVGDSQHSGVVPRHLRHDALFALADLVMRLDDHWQRLLEAGADLVVTVGIAGTEAASQAVSRIPGRVHFSLEARSRSRETLDAFHDLAHATCEAVAHERGVRFDFDRRVLSAPAELDARVQAALLDACREQAVPHGTIPSGAGHDAAIMANSGVPSGMLFVRNQNGSHNPREAMEIDDFMLGVQVLSDALERLAAQSS